MLVTCFVVRRYRARDQNTNQSRSRSALALYGYDRSSACSRQSHKLSDRYFINKESKREMSSRMIKTSWLNGRDVLSIQHDTLNGPEHQSIQKMQDPLKTGHRDDTWGKACRALDEEKVLLTPPPHICFFYILYTLFRSMKEPAAADRASRPNQPLS